VSVLCLGTMTFGDRTSAAEARDIVEAAHDAGVNFVDTADTYVKGESERIVGDAIRPHRRDWILATKAGNPVTGAKHEGGLSRRWLAQACDDYLHKDDWTTPIAETVGAIGDLIRAGKIRYFGVSNYRGWRIAEVMRECERQNVPPPAICQPYYNLLNRMPEVEILPACDHYGIGVAPYSPIARGVLTGKYAADGSAPSESRAAVKDQRFLETEHRVESYAIAQTLAAHARRTGRTPTALALAWLWANRIVSSVVAGPRTLAQWHDYTAAVGTAWTDDDEALVDSLVRPGHPSTPGYTDPRYPFFGRRRA
jgi:aryl-alcohol dehydrogenase-like predicted oxidoreductase